MLVCVLKDARRPLEVVSVADSRFSSKVELSVRFGKTLLVLECEGVEPMLYPLARKDLVHQGPRYVVQVGDKVTPPLVGPFQESTVDICSKKAFHLEFPGQIE